MDKKVDLTVLEAGAVKRVRYIWHTRYDISAQQQISAESGP